MTIYDLCQLAGGLILTFAFLPQIVQIIKTRSVKDLNLATFSVIAFAVMLMEVNAIGMVITKHVGTSFLVTNTLSVLTDLVMVGLIVRYRDRG